MSKALIPVLEGAIEQQHRSKIRFFPVDERLVPINHADNNTGVYLKQLTQIFDENQFAVLPEETLGDG
jgi:6-phosphogluconolactonase/glucosamine-6-phosphate isomerase/deaminase